MHRFAALGTVLLIWACASSQPEDTESSAKLRAGDPNGPPTIGALPEVARGSSTPRLQQGLSLARQVLDTRLPEPPLDHSYQVLQSWIDREVAPWVAKRRDGVDEARFQFGLEHDASVDEKVVGNAVLGILQEDTALALTHIPQPTELDTEPEVAAIFRDLVQTQVQPFQNAALVEYRDCASDASEEGAQLRRWANFCHGRLDRLESTLRAER
ncbi:MAG TPA: hypothetical protein VGI70_08100 [Polyangiales bacterium]|jgi:hypothetical protein